MKCDIIANGVVAAAKNVGLKVPLVVRLAGTNVELGKKILSQSGLPIVTADNLDEAAQTLRHVFHSLLGFVRWPHEERGKAEWRFYNGFQWE